MDSMDGKTKRICVYTEEAGALGFQGGLLHPFKYPPSPPPNCNPGNGKEAQHVQYGGMLLSESVII